MSNSIQAQIQCPFFVNERNSLLCCEGFIDSTCMTTAFPNTEAKTAYIKTHCFHIDGGGCCMAKNLYEKYKKIEEDEERKKRLREQQRIKSIIHSDKV